LDVEINLKKIILFIGNYGSGKTEVAVNFAINQAKQGKTVRLVDLDIVNPYFRSRECRDTLESQGIKVILPGDGYLNADLPIIAPEVRGSIEREDGITILDVGGDKVGATVLGSLAASISRSGFDMLLVHNARRPFTDTVEGSVTIAREIEAAARLKLSGVIGNTHLMDNTSTEILYEGCEKTRQVSKALDLPFLFISAEQRLLDGLDMNRIGVPVLPLTRLLLPPWRRKEKLGPANFLLG